jgi:DNA gyrase subunit A
MGVEPDDAVIAVQMTDGTGQMFLGTRDGMAIRFPEADVRPMGRTAFGVRGISLREGDSVVAMEAIPAGADASVMTVCENGYGKRTAIDEYRVQSRGGVGIISIHATDRNGQVVGIACVSGEDELMLITQQGKILRMPTSGTRPIGRATQGVRLIEIEADDRVVSVVRLAERDDEREDGQDDETSLAE